MKYKLLLILILFFVMVGCASANISIPAAGGYTISSSGVYDLTGNINAEGTGLTNNADNVIVYGHGYTVYYENSAWGYGFRGDSAHTNVTLKDINFVCVNASYTDGSAICSTAINNLNIVNCTGNTSAGYGISIENSNGSSIINCAAITSGSGVHGLYLANNDNLIISNTSGICTNATRTACDGMYIYNVTHMNISDCTATSEKGIAAYIQYNKYANISNLSCVTQNNTGLYLLNNNYNNFVNSAGSSYSSKGMRLVNSTYNTLIGCSGVSVSDHGIYLSSTTNNTFKGCSYSSNTTEAIHLETTARDNTFSQLTVSSPYGSTPHSSKHIMAMGDSITYLDYGVYTSNTLNGVNPTWYFSNRGLNGETSVEGSGRFLQELQIYTPQYVLIMYGTNDVYQSIPHAATVSNILEMAATARQYNATPYILLVTPSSGDNTSKLELNAALSSAATEAGYKVINTWDSIDTIPLNGVNDSYNLSNYQDSDHPNDVGFQLLGTYIANQMLRTSEYHSSTISGVAPYTARFTDRSPYATAWYWDFENDGVVDSNETNPVHTYGKEGKYSVNLTIYNKYGSFSTVKKDYVTVSAHTPPSILDQLWEILKRYFGDGY